MIYTRPIVVASQPPTDPFIASRSLPMSKPSQSRSPPVTLTDPVGTLPGQGKPPNRRNQLLIRAGHLQLKCYYGNTHVTGMYNICTNINKCNIHKNTTVYKKL